MVMYQYYNADLLEIPKSKDKDTMAYVDDLIMMAMADTFTKAHNKLSDMMTREGGIMDWLSMHNSPLEYSKLALIDFAHSQNPKERTTLHLPQGDIKPSESTKYLGIIFNQHLNWKVETVIRSGTW